MLHSVHALSIEGNKLPCTRHCPCMWYSTYCTAMAFSTGPLTKACAQTVCVHESVIVSGQYLTASATLLAASVAIACSTGSLTRCLTGGVGFGSTMMPGPGLADTEKLCLRSGSVGSSVLRLCKHAVLLTAQLVYAVQKR